MSDLVREICRQARSHPFAADWQGAPALGALFMGGIDAPDFLQAQLTSDVAALAPGQGHLSARLDRKGALVAWFSLHRLPAQGQPFPTYLAILPRAGITHLADDLSRSVINEDLLLENVSDEFDGLVVQGRAGDLPEFSVRAEPAGWTIVRSFIGDPGWLRLVPRGAARPVADDVASWRNDEAHATAWDWLTLEAGWPQMGVDLPAGKRVLPQTGLEDHVLSTTKGCYLGQEVVARIRTYGSVPEALRGLVFMDLDPESLPAFPVPGTALRGKDGGKLGTWARGALSVARARPIALAFLDRHHRTPGMILETDLAGGAMTRAEVVLLPFHSVGDEPERARHLHEQAVQSFSRGQDDTAVSLLEEALRLDPGHAETYEALGVILGRNERYHEAIAIFTRLEEIAPLEPMVHTNLSLFYMKLGDREEAERQLARATEKRFAGLDDAMAAQERAGAEAAARHADAERKSIMFGEVLEVDPDDPLALMGLGNALAELEDFAAAEPHLARACAVQHDNSAAFATHGKVLERLGRDAEAADVYRQGVVVASRKGDLMPLREMEHRLLMLAGAQRPI